LQIKGALTPSLSQKLLLSLGSLSPSARTIIDARLSARIVADWVISVSAARSAGSRGFWFFTGRV